MGRQSPALIEEMKALDVDEVGYLGELFSELSSHTGYLAEDGPAPEEAQHTLRFALEVAYLAHRGQKRRSGEPFIVHPVQVAIILAQSRMCLTSVVAGILHDTVEDTFLTFADVEALFGAEVRQIVEGETKVSKLPKVVRGLEGELPSSKRDQQAENLRSMFIAMADDWRIVVVKLADRLHNMRTLQYMPPHKRLAIARETLEIFAPLAHRLGCWQFKTELADLAFCYLFPEDYEALKSYIESKAMAYSAAVALAEEKVSTLTRQDPWLEGRVRRVQVEGRTKSIHSTWRKMQRRDCRVEEVSDLLALRIIVETDPDWCESEYDASALCYHILGRIHCCWTPMPRTLKDYISSPKPNGYRSLHTTVLIGEGAQPLEVQIRTAAMHSVAEHGAAAHWAYAQGESASLPWRTAIMKWEAEQQCAHQFMQLVRQELLCSRVFVFSEGGRILDLALGATLADAAAALGVDVDSASTPYICSHNMCEAAHLHTPLSNGDIVCFDKAAADAAAGEQQAEQQAEQQTEQRGEAAATDGGAALGGAALGVHLPSGVVVPSRGPVARPAAEPAPPPSAADRARSELAAERAAGRPGRPSRATSGVELIDGCLLDEVAWHTCEHCLPLPGDALVCTLQATPYTGGTQSSSVGIVHRASEGLSGLGLPRLGSRVSRCKALRRQLADGSQLLADGESMCQLVESAFQSDAGEGGGSDGAADGAGGAPREQAGAAAAGGAGAGWAARRKLGGLLTTCLVVFVNSEHGALLAVTAAVTAATHEVVEVASRRNGANTNQPTAAAFEFRVRIAGLAQLEELTAAVAALPQVLAVRRDTLEMMLEASADAFWQNAYDRAE